MKLSTKKTPQQELILATGEVIDPKNVDQLIDAYEATDARHRRLGDTKKQLCLAMAALTEGEKKTRRVEGERRRAKVVMPDDSFNQGILKEAWHSFPQLRDRALSIERIRLKKRDWAKLEETKGPPALDTFIKMIREANDGPSGTPQITVEL